MNATTKEWIAIAMFFGMFTATMIGEIAWLVKKHWATTSRATAFVLISDIASFCIGSALAFIVIGVIFALAWDGSLMSVPGGDSSIWAAMIFAALFPPILFFFSKRLMLLLLKIRSGGSAWRYSLAITALKIVITFLPPILFLYFFR